MEDSAKAAVIRHRILRVGDLESGWSDRRQIETHDDDDVPDRVARIPGAIGITALGHVRSPVKVLAIADSETGPGVLPTQENVYAGRYPLTRTIDLLAVPSAEGRIDPLLGEWVRFVLSREGQAIVLEQGVFLPLSGMFSQRAIEQLDRVDGSACRSGAAPD